jgi:hypothetical protein
LNLNFEFDIFRDSRRQLPAAELITNLRTFLLRMPLRPQLEELLHALLLAGELECALSDAPASAEDAEAACRLTSLLAEAAIRAEASDFSAIALLPHRALRICERFRVSSLVSLSVPEGFAYYALHPLDYADLIERLPLNTPRAFVVGVRSIGTTISGVVCAKLQQFGVHAERTTVRPTGHPYQRNCGLDARQRTMIRSLLSHDANFIVCDEGPGRSGSSLLSVADALEREGVPASQIVVLCSHQPDLNTLCAPDAAQRWRRYRSAATGMTRRLPAAPQEYAGGGEWRRHLIPTGGSWHGVWPQMERLRYLSADHEELLTFEGYGPYGAAARARNEHLSNSSYGLVYLGNESGFGKHKLPDGRTLNCSNLTSEWLSRMAEYCAWRARTFRTGDVNSHVLEAMTRNNFEREFGKFPEGPQLCVERATICDNRMAPHQWLATSDRRVVKLDAAIHGDDHFFPGPCDIAWDLAGVIVEWNLDPAAREFFLRQYRRESGDDASPRIKGYEIAYAMFRLAWSKMAAASVAASEEAGRLMRDYRQYRRVVQNLVSRGSRLAFCSNSAGANAPA